MKIKTRHLHSLQLKRGVGHSSQKITKGNNSIAKNFRYIDVSPMTNKLENVIQFFERDKVSRKIAKIQKKARRE